MLLKKEVELCKLQADIRDQVIRGRRPPVYSDQREKCLSLVIREKCLSIVISS